MNECPVMSQRRPEPGTFLRRTPAARKAVPSLTLYDCRRPQQVSASSVLAASSTECTGVGDVGPKFGTHVPDLGAREYFNLFILDRLSRKLDASCTIVKICWSFFYICWKLFRRGREGVYFFPTHMQATAPIPWGYLARELDSAREARQFFASRLKP